MSPQRLIFAGTPEFAKVALAALQAAGHEVALVLTQPDRPAGRGMKLQASPVKQWAQQHGVPVAQPRSLRLDGRFPEDAAQGRSAIEAARDAGATTMVVAAYGLILPQWVLDTVSCLNIHASLLPRWRGAAPAPARTRSWETSSTNAPLRRPAAALSRRGRFRWRRPRSPRAWPPCPRFPPD